MYRRRKALLLEWPISATKPEFKKSPFEVDASATSIESIFPVKQNSKKQAALCACTQLHATRKISYNCRGIIESARKQSHFISNTNIWRFCRLRTTNCLQLCSDMFRSFWMIPCLVRGRRGKISKQFVNPFIQLASTSRWNLSDVSSFFVGHVTDKKWQKLQSIESESHSLQVALGCGYIFCFRCVLLLFDTLSSYALRDPMALQLQASWNPEVAKKVRGHRILFHIHRNQFPQLLRRQIARPISRAICSVRATVVPGIQAPNSNKMNRHEEWIMMNNASTWVNIKAKRKYQHKNPMYDTSHETDSLLIQSRWHPKKPSRLLGNMSRKMGISAWIGWRSWFVSRYPTEQILNNWTKAAQV